MNHQIYNLSPTKHRDSISSPQQINRQNIRALTNPSSSKQQLVDAKTYTANNLKFIKNSPIKPADLLPPKAVPFQRTRRSGSREASFRDKSISNVSNLAKEKYQDQIKDSRHRADSIAKVTDLKKRISEEKAEKQKWKETSQANAQKISKLSQELTKLKEHNKWLQDQIQKLSKLSCQSESELRKANQVIQSLNKTINNNNIHLTSYKQKEIELDSLRTLNKKLSFDNQSLTKTIATLKSQIQRKNVSNLQEECIKKSEIIVTLQRQLDRAKTQLKEKIQSQRILDSNLRQVQKVLYQKENQLKKIAIHLNFMGRKQAMSIDDVRSKKDLEIKIMRDKYNRAAKDLKELRDSREKDERNDKKKMSKQKDILRKIKSQKQLRVTSESDEFTFQLSSQA